MPNGSLLQKIIGLFKKAAPEESKDTRLVQTALSKEETPILYLEDPLGVYAILPEEVYDPHEGSSPRFCLGAAISEQTGSLYFFDIEPDMQMEFGRLSDETEDIDRLEQAITEAGYNLRVTTQGSLDLAKCYDVRYERILSVREGVR